ncbi:hypothetical protein ACIPJK_15190 [Streptomyces roseus]|uniref:hypothetical protein n=1 Tax=Streptomyces roseus TaxID=66430 RepID=UPI003802FCEB
MRGVPAALGLGDRLRAAEPARVVHERFRREEIAGQSGGIRPRNGAAGVGAAVGGALGVDRHPATLSRIRDVLRIGDMRPGRRLYGRAGA